MPTAYQHFPKTTPDKAFNSRTFAYNLHSYLIMLQDDVALIKKVGLDSYKFSISWSRILPGTLVQ